MPTISQTSAAGKLLLGTLSSEADQQELLDLLSSLGERERGWAHFTDTVHTSGSPLELNAGNSYTAAVEMDTVALQGEWNGDDDLPYDIVTKKLIGMTDGNMYDFRLSFKAKDGAQAVLLDVDINIGGGQGEIFRRSTSIAKGATVETSVAMDSMYFTGATFIANGGSMSFSTIASTMEIWDITLLIFKKYQAL
jgi:hypothetical protein